SFGPLALGQVEHESDALTPASFEGRRADQHGHTAAIFPEILFFVWLKSPGRVQYWEGAFVALAPFGRRQVCPAHLTRDEIPTVVPHHQKKRVIGLENPAFRLPNEDADNVGVDQAAN